MLYGRACAPSFRLLDGSSITSHTCESVANQQQIFRLHIVDRRKLALGSLDGLGPNAFLLEGAPLPMIAQLYTYYRRMPAPGDWQALV